MRYPGKNGKQRQHNEQGVSGAAALPASPTSATSATAERRRPFRRLRLRQRVVPLLVALVLLSSCGIVALAYLGARADAITSAQSRAAEDVRVERQLLADQGASLTIQDGQLLAGVDNAAIALNDDSTIVDRTRSLVNGYATIYQLEGSSLVAISTNLPNGKGNGAQGSRALGDTLSGPAYDALLGQCGPTDAPACHHSYRGVITMHGVAYAAAFEPLSDASGAFVGALSVAMPVESVLGPTVQFAVMLLLVALLMALVAIAAGAWIFGSISDRVFGALDTQLDVVADATIDLDHLARAQIERAERQSRAARQVSDEARALNALARAMHEGESELRKSAGGIWGEMSHPGAAPDPATTLHWARQAAVASGRIGVASAQARDLCQHIVTLMNHIIAEGNAVSERGHEMQVCAHDLRGSVEQVEMTLGERLINRPQGLGSIPVLRHIRPASQRLRKLLSTHAPRRAHARQSAPDTPVAPRPVRGTEMGNTGGFGAVIPRGLTGRSPRVSPVRPPRPGNHLNHMDQTSQHRDANAGAGEWRRSGGPGAQASGSAQSRVPQPSRPRGGSAHSGPPPPPRNGSNRGTPPHDPRTAHDPAHDLSLPDLPENDSSSWHWINPNENRWLDDDETSR